ncbi:MAG: DUF1778 domain-containing protein [Hormoscilla sp. GM7CHS1pb]|nr:DUF1778 domain-containing protein [Hormoscilla sp. GM7CHS1pb]
MSEAASIKRVSGSDRTLDKQEIDSHERLVLSDRDRDLFISVMSNPPRLNGKLKNAIAEYQEQYGKIMSDDMEF